MTSNAQAKLDYIAGTKTAIKDAIETKGVTVDDATFREYADKIADIPSPTDYVLREYTGSATWTKPAGLKELFVVCIGGGAGGGSGSRGASGVLRRGGGGGGGTVIVWRKISAAELGATETVTVGAGGAGGAAVTADDTDGNDGTAGGDTSFGALVLAKGGNKGLKGINASSANNYSTAISVGILTPAQGLFSYNLTGGVGSDIAGGNGKNAAANILVAVSSSGYGGGASGGGKNTSNNIGIGGDGSILSKIDNTSSAARTGGSANNPGNTGLDNQGLQLLMQYNTTAIPTKGLGTSGAGGGAGDNTPTAAGAGGNGGSYGGSGGGGGASLNGANSGKGGDGAGGLCLVYEQY